MTKDEIIEMAIEAGCVGSSAQPHEVWEPCGEENVTDIMFVFASLVAAAEREACAKLCSAQVQIEKYGHAAHAALMCENSIRARGTP